MNSNLSTPLVSIGMPVFNSGDFLLKSVTSIIDQTYQNWELILIDDGSTDGSVEIIKQLNHPKIRIFQDGKNKGLATRLNEAISLSKGEFFARMDGDDISLPERLKKQVAFLKKHSEIDLLACRAETINSSGDVIGSLPFFLTHEELCKKPWRSIYMPHPTWMGKIEWFKKYRYSIPAPYLCEDQELLLRAYKQSKFACIDEFLFHYRVKDHVNYRNLIKRYLSVFKMQFKNFFVYEKRYAFLSLITLFARLIKTALILMKFKKELI